MHAGRERPERGIAQQAPERHEGGTLGEQRVLAVDRVYVFVPRHGHRVVDAPSVGVYHSSKIPAGIPPSGPHLNRRESYFGRVVLPIRDVAGRRISRHLNLGQLLIAVPDDTAPRRPPNDDQHIAGQRGEPSEQALRRQAGQPPVQQVGDLGLVDAPQLGSRGLGEVASRDRAHDLGGQARLQRALSRPGSRGWSVPQDAKMNSYTKTSQTTISQVAPSHARHPSATCREILRPRRAHNATTRAASAVEPTLPSR